MTSRCNIGGLHPIAMIVTWECDIGLPHQRVTSRRDIWELHHIATSECCITSRHRNVTVKHSWISIPPVFTVWTSCHPLTASYLGKTEVGGHLRLLQCRLEGLLVLPDPHKLQELPEADRAGPMDKTQTSETSISAPCKNPRFPRRRVLTVGIYFYPFSKELWRNMHLEEA